jgi:hypothetical protein
VRWDANRLDHLGCFKVVAIDGDSFRHDPALVVGHSVNVHLESGYKHHTGHMLLFEAKDPLVIFRCRIIGEDHGRGSLPGLHDQRFSGAGSDHSFHFGLAIRAKCRHQYQAEQCQQNYYDRFSVHKPAPLYLRSISMQVRELSDCQ